MDHDINDEFEETRAFFYGFTLEEIARLTDPFYLVAASEEASGHPLASVN